MQKSYRLFFDWDMSTPSVHVTCLSVDVKLFVLYLKVNLSDTGSVSKVSCCFLTVSEQLQLNLITVFQRSVHLALHKLPDHNTYYFFLNYALKIILFINNGYRMFSKFVFQINSFSLALRKLLDQY